MSADIHTLSPRPYSRKSKHAAPAAVVQHPSAFARDWDTLVEPKIANVVSACGMISETMLGRLSLTRDATLTLALMVACRHLGAIVAENAAEHGLEHTGELLEWAHGMVGKVAIEAATHKLRAEGARS